MTWYQVWICCKVGNCNWARKPSLPTLLQLTDIWDVSGDLDQLFHSFSSPGTQRLQFMIRLMRFLQGSSTETNWSSIHASDILNIYTSLKPNSNVLKCECKPIYVYLYLCHGVDVGKWRVSTENGHTMTFLEHLNDFLGTCERSLKDFLGTSEYLSSLSK